MRYNLSQLKKKTENPSSPYLQAKCNFLHLFASTLGKIVFLKVRKRVIHLYPVHLVNIPMSICTLQSIFSHSYVVNE
jgi:hypothetical protein